MGNCKSRMLSSSGVSCCKVAVDKRQKISEGNFHPSGGKFSEFCCKSFGRSIEKRRIKESGERVERIILTSVLFAEWDRFDDFKTRSGSSLSVIWRDDDVDAGCVVRLLAAGDGSFVESLGEVVIDQLRKGGEERIGDI